MLAGISPVAESLCAPGWSAADTRPALPATWPAMSAGASLCRFRKTASSPGLRTLTLHSVEDAPIFFDLRPVAWISRSLNGLHPTIAIYSNQRDGSSLCQAGSRSTGGRLSASSAHSWLSALENTRRSLTLRRSVPIPSSMPLRLLAIDAGIETQILPTGSLPGAMSMVLTRPSAAICSSRSSSSLCSGWNAGSNNRVREKP